MVGTNVLQYPTIVQQVALNNNDIAAHSMTHPYPENRSDSVLDYEITAFVGTLRKISGNLCATFGHHTARAITFIHSGRQHLTLQSYPERSHRKTGLGFLQNSSQNVYSTIGYLIASIKCMTVVATDRKLSMRLK